MLQSNHQNYTENERKVLTKELNEDPNQIHAHLESFRRWLHSMPHLKCPDTDDFLIKFLRIAKYDHKLAQIRLDNFCTARASDKGYPKYFKYPPVTDVIVEKVVNSLQIIPLGQTQNGVTVLFYKLSCWDPFEISIETMLQISYMILDMLMVRETTQINGVISLLDLHDTSHRVMEICGETEITKAGTKIWQDAYPIRVKGIILHNEPTLFHYLVTISEFFMKEKHRKRMHRTKKLTDFKKVIEKYPGMSELLPSEYGGTSKVSIQEKANKLLVDLKEFYSKPNPLMDIKVDESKRPATAMHYFKEHAEFKGENPFRRKSGTFTKFDDVL